MFVLAPLCVSERMYLRVRWIESVRGREEREKERERGNRTFADSKAAQQLLVLDVRRGHAGDQPEAMLRHQGAAGPVRLQHINHH